MDRLYVTGGARLAGSVRVSGAKNSALKLMAASLLAPGKSVVRNVPRIRDCNVMAEMLEHFGVRVSLRDGVAELDATDVRRRRGARRAGPSDARVDRGPGSAARSMRPRAGVDARRRRDRCSPGGSARPRAGADGGDDPVRARLPDRRGGRAARRRDHAGLPERDRDREPAVRRRPRAGRDRDRQRRARARDRRRRELPDRHGREHRGRRLQHDRDRGRRRAAAHRSHGGRPIASRPGRGRRRPSPRRAM